MLVKELVHTVSTDSSCLYEIRCQRRGLIYNRRRWDEIGRAWKEKEVLYAIPMKIIDAQVLYWIICVKD